MTPILSLTLAPPSTATKGRLGSSRRLAHDLQLLLAISKPDTAGRIGRHTGGGGVGPVHGAEGVGHVQLRHGGQLLGKARDRSSPRAGSKRRFSSSRISPGLQSGGLGLGVRAHDILGEDDLAGPAAH